MERGEKWHVPLLELVHTLPVSPPHPTIYSLFPLCQLEVHTQGDFENHVLKMAETPDRKKQHSWIIYREEFSADQEYHFGTLCE